MDAAQSGPIDHGQSSWIETTVNGTGTLYFYWRVSSEDNNGHDYLEVTVDGNPEAEISGFSGWDSYQIDLTDPGSHTIRWTYWKDSDFTAGQDPAWLDEVTFNPVVEAELSFQIKRS